MVTIRRKLLILLLLTSLVPLLISTAIERLSLRNLGRELAEDSRRYLTTSTQERLQDQVRDFWENLIREKSFFELTIDYQANEIEHRLASAPTAGTTPFFPQDVEKLLEASSDKAPARGRFYGPNDPPATMSTFFEHQVSAVSNGASKETALPDLRRLSTMTPVFKDLHRRGRELIVRQQVVLESGGHVRYPAHAGTAAYDPRQSPWYRLARESKTAIWHIPTAGDQEAPITVARALRPDGGFAGVSAIDIPMTDLYRHLMPPGQWIGKAEVKIVAPEEGGKLAVLLELGGSGLDHWKVPANHRFLESYDQAGLEAIGEDARAGKTGIRRMPFNGNDAVWAHGGSLEGKPFPVIIYPFAEIVAEVDAAEKHVWGRTVASLQVTGLLIIVVVLSAIGMATRRSRTVTEPINLLVEATRRLAAGDFEMQVDIRSGDELEELGQAFNTVGPRLQERERMQRDLEVAKEIQRHLLPETQPTLKGFDIYGNSLYCDETGGDYFDYIPMAGDGEDRLAVVVGDVTGHGIGSALLMTSARGMLRSQAERFGKDLTSLFAELNSQLVRDTGDSQFMTLFYGYLEEPGSTLNWLSGGHGPIYHVRESGKVIEELQTGGIPLGIIDNTGYEAGEPLSMCSGDFVAIGTDGIWEATDGVDQMFGLERFCDTLQAHADGSAEEIYSSVMTAVERFQGDKRQDDDITLMVIKAL